MEIISKPEAIERGLKFYFTGVACNRGHTDKRYTSTRTCFSCHSENGAKNRDNPEFLEMERARQRSEKYRSSVNARRNTVEGKAAISAYQTQNRTSINSRNRDRYANDQVVNTMVRARSPLSKILLSAKRKGVNYLRTSSLGYTPQDLREHLESLFLEGMSWENHGEWEVDHVKSVFSLVSSGVCDPAEINRLENLQPLWRAENKKKGRI